MQTTLRAELRRLEQHLIAGRISEEEYNIAMRERRGKLLTQGGRLARKRKREGIEASELVSREHSVARQVKFAVRASEIISRDEMIRLDRQLMKNLGTRSMMVKVIKRHRQCTIAKHCDSCAIDLDFMRANPDVYPTIRSAMAEAGITE